MKTLPLTLLTVAAGVCTGLFLSAEPSAKVANRFVVGEVYTFAWDCLPQAVMPNPCYSEPLRIKAVHDDGWLDVEDAMVPEGYVAEPWTVNPARAIGYTFNRKDLRQAHR
jgi:hypothetical protein